MHVKINDSRQKLIFFFAQVPWRGSGDKFFQRFEETPLRWICTAICDFPKEHKDGQRLYEQCLREHIN